MGEGVFEFDLAFAGVFEAVGELGEGFGFDLANALAGEAEGFADFFERVRLVVAEAEAHAEDGGFALVHNVHHFHHAFQHIVLDELIFGRFQALVHHDLAERPAGFGLVGLGRAVVDADRFFDDGQLFLLQAEDAADFFGRRPG